MGWLSFHVKLPSAVTHVLEDVDDYVVMGASAMPGGGSVTGGLLGAAFAFAEGKDIKTAARIGAVDAAFGLVPMFRFGKESKYLAKPLALVGGKIGGRLEKNAAGKILTAAAGKIPGSRAEAALNRAGLKGVGAAVTRSMVRAAAEGGAHYLQTNSPPGSGSAEKSTALKIPKQIPVRPAGADMSSPPIPYDGHPEATYEYDDTGFAQQPV